MRLFRLPLFNEIQLATGLHYASRNRHEGACCRTTMAFRIETAARGRVTVFALSGRIEKQAIEELRKLLESQKELHEIVLDLKDVCLVDREVLHFFISCEADGVTLEHCTPYIREWMEREKG